MLADYPPVELGIYAVYPERRNLSPKGRAYVDYLRDRFGDTRTGIALSDLPAIRVRPGQAFRLAKQMARDR